MKAEPSKEQILTLRTAATRLNSSKAYIRKLIQAEVLPAFHRGGVLVVKSSDIERFIKELKPKELKPEKTIGT